MDRRYFRSLGALSEAELNLLKYSRAAVIGCGGLGGYVAEELARVGFGELVVSDPDFFEETNLNRQLLSTEQNIGKSKALETAERVMLINSGIKVFPFCEAFSPENAEKFLSGCDIVIDALDSGSTRRALAAACESLNIPLVHGAIDGWRAQVSVLLPGSRAFDYMYPEGCDERECPVTSLAFTPAVAASIEVCEAVKVIIGRGTSLSGRLLMIDLLHEEFNIVTL